MATAPGEGCCTFRPDIEGLRAVAILAVVVYHAGLPGFAGGFVGVDVFFVLSGFLITGILVRELTRTGTVELAQFWARRMRRLLPAAFVVLAATGIASAIWLPPAERGAAAQGIAASTLYAANWVFATQALDYLAADHALSPTLHFWSLAVEEQFYLVWPLLLLGVTWGVRGEPARMTRRLLVAMVAICLISFALSLFLTRAAQPMAFFASPPRFWQLGTGALLAIGWARVERLPPTLREGLAGVGLVAVLASISLMPTVLAAGFTWPGALALAPTLGTAALVAAGSATRVGRALAVKPLAFIGQLSYSWYLWHWGVLLFWEQAVGPAAMPVKAALLLGALGISWLSLRFIENPVRFHPRLAAARPALVLGGLLTAAGLAVAWGVWRRDAVFIEQDLVARGLITYRPTASEARREVPRPVVDGCQVPWGETRLNDHVYGDPAGEAAMHLIGDSHSVNLFEGLDLVAKERGLRLVVRAKSACTLADVTIFDRKRSQVDVACDRWREAVLAELAAERPAEVVLVDSAWGYHERVQGAVGDRVAGRALWVAGMRRTVERARASGARVTVVAENPRAPFNVPTCVSNTPTEPERCNFPRAAALEAQPAEREAAGQVVDLSDTLCDDTTCRVVVGGTLVFTDVGHYTAAFSRSLAPVLSERIFGRSE